MEAQKIGLINKGQVIDRLAYILTFLENRTLNSYGYPFWFYDARTGNNAPQYSDKMTVHVDTVDTGRLFVALNNLRDFNPEWKERINDIVYNKSNNRSNYAALIDDIKSASGSNSIYTYFVASGFASFWPNELGYVPVAILNNIFNSGNNITTYNVSLPKAEISCEPLLNSLFELKSNSKITDLAKSVYLAHEVKYNATGQYVAFSEGNGRSDIFVYEWVVLPDGRTWNVTDINRNNFDINPIIYTKVSMSFLAIYNTSFARNMTIYLEKSLPEPSSGYSDGADYSNETESRTLISQVGSNTNGLILEAARYAIQNNP
jgi:Protein of unknown function (DUF3131)